MRLLFFLASSSVGGGTRMFFELSNRLQRAGHEVRIQSPARRPDWFPLEVPFDPPGELGECDVVVVSHLFQVPLVLQLRPHQPILWWCQGYEGLAEGESSELLAALALPFQAAAISRPVQQQLAARGRSSFYVPAGLDRERLGAVQELVSEERILLVADPEVACKGVGEGLRAVACLCLRRPGVRLRLLTRNLRWQPPTGLGFGLEVVRRPPLHSIAEWMRGCRLLLCSSRYEGLGLPALEAMALGIPVVSSPHPGTLEYARPGENMLLAEPEGLARALESVLEDQDLAGRLRQGGLETVAGRFFWEETVAAFESACQASAGARVGPVACDLGLLLEGLERAGHYCPPAAQGDRRLNRADWERLLAGEDAGPLLLAIRRRSRGRLAPVLRAHYDLSRLLLAFPQQAEAWEAVRRMLSP